MEKLINDFDREFDNMSASENLYAEAMAHLLDKDTNEFVESLGDEGCASMNAAADGGGSYE
ncbi:MAG: hypothetical protein IKU50_05310 [Bacteroidaceae bacterium]|nr:hypothetical protein [Bacteroidaceae bacterium]